MSFWQVIVQSLLFHRRIHFSVAMGVAAATAVLTGALLVGDSVRGTLRHLTLDRLGRIDEAVVGDRFFRAELGTELAAAPAFQQHYDSVAPAIVFPTVTVETTASPIRRATSVMAIGCDERFWKLGSEKSLPAQLPAENEIILSEPLASALDASAGDEIILRLPKISDVPADSPLGRKSGRISSVRLKVIEVIASESLGRFALRPRQASPQNAYVAPQTLQRLLKQPGRVNALFIAGQSATPPTEQATKALEAALAPKLADFGIRVDRVRKAFKPAGNAAAAEQVIYDYYHITTDRMVFSPAAKSAIEQAIGEFPSQPVSTYLANTIALGNSAEGIPYSTIAAVDSNAATGPAQTAPGQAVSLADDEIALNQWAAEDLGAQLGDEIRIDFFAPETTHGVAVEKSARFKLAAIVPLTEPSAGFSRRGPARFGQPPTTANDPDMTPIVEGVTDKESINNWDPPFPYDQKRLRLPKDEDYWENHRATPKAFISYAAGQRIWGSRFGDATGFRVPATAFATEEALEGRVEHALREKKADLGFAILPLKRQGLAASAGTTPFDVLFLFLSFFIIAAALLLVAVLFKLGIEQRVAEVGTLLALGWQRRQTGWFLLWEGVGVATIGALIGVPLGIGYAWLMIVGLKTWWIGAVGTSSLALYWTNPITLVIGVVSGIVVSTLTIAWSLRHLRSVTTRELLAGQSRTVAVAQKRSWIWPAVAASLVVIAVALAILATRLGGESQAGAFVGAGAAILSAALITVWNRLRSPRVADPSSAARLSLGKLALEAAARNPSRSTLTIGLVAAASFLIIAMSAFRLAPTKTGAGGFDLVATSSDPIFADLNTPAGRDDLLGNEAPALENTKVLALRYRAGDDASCNNLYQSTQPRVLGVTPAMIKHYDDEEPVKFTFAGSAAATPEEKANPWLLLSSPAVQGEPIPVVLDKNTAMYSLHLYRGIGEEFEVAYDGAKPLKLKVVGLLSNSILQGSVLMGEADFLRQFPEIGGYRFFLLRTPEEKLEQVSAVLEDKLSDQGFDAVPTDEMLTQLLAVQNTYLSTFQSLGALGLLLGTFGLATVQLRSVLERRGELALLSAQGFRRSRIARLILSESVLLLLGGLATGAVAAMIAVLPHMLLADAQVNLVELLLMLGIVLAIGVASSFVAVRATLRADIIAALRGE